MAIKTKKNTEDAKPLDTGKPKKDPGKKGLLSSDKKTTPEKIQKTVSKGGKNEGEKKEEKTPKKLVINSKKSQEEKKREEQATKRLLELLETCVAYAETLVIKSRYAGIDKKQLAFAAFLAMPDSENVRQKKFAEILGVHENTLVNWKFKKKTIQARDEIMIRHFSGHTPGIIGAMLENAKRRSHTTGLGDAAMIKLWLQYIEKWSEKSEVDVKSDGEKLQSFTWGLVPSQFAKPDKLPKKKTAAEENEEDD